MICSEAIFLKLHWSRTDLDDQKDLMQYDAIWCHKELTWPCRSRYEPDWQEDAVACAMDCNGKLRWRRHDQAWQGYLRQPCHLFNNTRVQFTSCETRVALWRYSSEVKMTYWKNGVEWHSFGQTICKQLKSSSPFLSRIMHFATTRTHDVKAPSSAQPNNSGQKIERLQNSY